MRPMLLDRHSCYQTHSRQNRTGVECSPHSPHLRDLTAEPVDGNQRDAVDSRNNTHRPGTLIRRKVAGEEHGECDPCGGTNTKHAAEDHKVHRCRCHRKPQTPDEVEEMSGIKKG